MLKSSAASLHTTAAIVNCDSIEYYTIHQLLFYSIKGNIIVEDGFSEILKKPGLGLSLSPEDLE